MGEWYRVDESLPLLTAEQNVEITMNIQDIYLDTLFDETGSHRCGAILKVPLLAADIATHPEVYVDAFLVDDVVTSFNKCDAFVIFLNIILRAEDKEGHANILYFRKSDKTIFWIEPQISGTHQYTEYVLPFVDAIKKRLNIVDYKTIHPEGTCIQAVAKDKNCVFWSFLLYLLILRGEAKTAEEATKMILQKFPTPELLRNYIEKMKSGLYKQYKESKTDPSVAGKRHSPWVLSTVSQRQSRHRKTRRKHRPSKSRSKHLKSVKRTQKRASRRSN